MSNNANLSTLELQYMQSFNEDHMMDTCVIMTGTTTVSTAGGAVHTWTTNSTIDCGWGQSPYKFRSRELSSYGAEESSEILVRVRVSLDYADSIDTNDRLRLTHLKGVALTTPEDYDVQGFNEPNPAGIVVNVKRVEL
jgi:hypothetical protein